MMKRFTLTLICSLAFPAFALAQGHDSTSKPPPPHKTPTAPHYVTVTYTDDSFEVPDTLPVGLTRIRASNHGKDMHHATLVKVDSGKTEADLSAALEQSDAFPAWAHLLGGPQNTGTVTLDLPAGDYFWVCLMREPGGMTHVARGMIKSLHVGPQKAVGAAPVPYVTVTMADDSFKLSRSIRAGVHVLRVATDPSAQIHELMIVRLPPGKSATDLVAWGAHPGGPFPGADAQGVAPISPKYVAYTTVDFRRGHYVFICFVPDAKDGQTHAAHGMVKEVIIR